MGDALDCGCRIEPSPTNPMAVRSVPCAQHDASDREAVRRVLSRLPGQRSSIELDRRAVLAADELVAAVAARNPGDPSLHAQAYSFITSALERFDARVAEARAKARAKAEARCAGDRRSA